MQNETNPKLVVKEIIEIDIKLKKAVQMQNWPEAFKQEKIRNGLVDKYEVILNKACHLF